MKALTLIPLLLVIFLSGCATKETAVAPQQPIPSKQEIQTTPSQSSNSFDELVSSLPFAISPEQKEQSLMQGAPIVISPVAENGGIQLKELLTTKGWKRIASDRYNDGGTFTDYYFKDKHTPAVSFHFKWGMAKGAHESLTIHFIHPAKIGSRLLGIHPESLGKDVNINSLMECDGTLGETNPGVVECIKS